MNDQVREVLWQTGQRDWVDDILIEKAKIYMAHFKLESFKVSYPSLYATIRESIKQAAQTHISSN